MNVALTLRISPFQVRERKTLQETKVKEVLKCRELLINENDSFLYKSIL